MDQNLKNIFIKHGIDPFDVFLLDVSEWPQEAQDFLATQNAKHEAQPKPERKYAPCESEWQARGSVE